MPTSSKPDSTISPEEFQSLLSLAGLDITKDQAPLVLEELGVQLRNARLIEDAVQDRGVVTGGAFDPAFPKASGKDQSE